MNGCPQVGTGGYHSQDYYDGKHCCWCAALMPEDELAALNEQWDESFLDNGGEAL